MRKSKSEPTASALHRAVQGVIIKLSSAGFKGLEGKDQQAEHARLQVSGRGGGLGGAALQLLPPL